MNDGAPMLTKAMVLAAGRGLRLRPITDTLPKPLVPVAGRAMIDRVLDALAAAGVADCVVNTHYLGHMIEAHLADRKTPAIRMSPERGLLDTGGGLAKALPLLGRDPFFSVNADILWQDGAQASALVRLADAYDHAGMDGLLLLMPVDGATGYDGKGDFYLARDGRLTRRGSATAAPYVYTGVQILHPRVIANHPAGAFSLNLFFDRAIDHGRLYGLVHDGRWYHVGDARGLQLAEAALAPPDDTP
ncbi:MAG: MurNAc alpha-1-phosphate uridylyltransferase [Alphaproteobacteria bacterium]|jgi:MurNAc alpha-1-phosphate uridylyltransferase